MTTAAAMKAIRPFFRVIHSLPCHALASRCHRPGGHAALTPAFRLLAATHLSSCPQPSRPTALSAKHQQLVDTHQSKLQAAYSRGEIALFVRECKSLADGVKAFSDNQRALLAEQTIDLLEKACFQILPSDLAVWIWCLGRIGLQAGIWRHRVILLKAFHHLLSLPWMTAKDLITACNGLVKAGITVDMLESKLLIKVSNRLSYDPRGIASILSLLAAIGVPWASLSLWDTVVRNAHLMNAEDASMALSALTALMGESSIPAANAHTLQQIACRALCEDKAKESKDKTTAQLVVTLTSLAGLRMQSSYQLREQIEASLMALVSKCDAQQQAVIVHSLGALIGRAQGQWRWSLPLQTALEAALVQKMVKQTPQGISMILYGFSTLCLYHQLGYQLTKALEQKAASSFSSAYPQAVANAAYALGMMDAYWGQFDAAFQTALLNPFLTPSKHFLPQHYSNFIYGLAAMDVTWRKLAAHSDQLIATYLGVIPIMDAQQLTNTMYATIMMAFDCMDSAAPWSLFHALCQRYRTLQCDSKEAKSQAKVFFEVLSAFPQGHAMILEELGSKPSIDVPAANITNQAHRRVAKEFCRLLPDFEVENEFSCVGGVWDIDIALKRDGQVVAFVEVNGMVHYKLEGQLRRKDLLKEFIYAHTFPGRKIYRIDVHEKTMLDAVRAAAQEIMQQ